MEGAAALAQLGELRRLARAQRRALRTGQVERFTALLAERQVLIEALGGTGPAASGEAPPGWAADLPVAAYEESRAVLEEIVGGDRESAQTLGGRLEALRGELGRVRQGRRAQAGYRRPTGPAAGRVDRAG